MTNDKEAAAAAQPHTEEGRRDLMLYGIFAEQRIVSDGVESWQRVHPDRIIWDIDTHVFSVDGLPASTVLNAGTGGAS